MSTPWYSRFTRVLGSAAAPGALRTPEPQDTPDPSYERQASVAWLRNYTRQVSETMDLPAELCADLALEIAERSLTEGQARDAVMQIVAERQRQATVGLGAGGLPTGLPAGNALIYGGNTNDNPAFLARAIEGALYARMSGTAPAEESRQFMGMSLVQIAGEMLTRQGVRNVARMAPSDVLEAAAWNSGGRGYMADRSFTRGGAEFGYHTTSDFAQLLVGAGERFVLTVFQAAASPLKKISRQRSARDFRAISGLQLSNFGTLPRVAESGEIKHGTFAVRAETYKLETFAKQFGLSRQAIINDDLAVFSDPILIMGRAAAETEAQVLASIINTNAVLASDSKGMFHLDHGNLATTGSKPSIAALDAGRQAMRRQKDADGVTPLAPSPKYILSAGENETAIEQLVAPVQAATSAGVNPFAGKLEQLVDPRLDPLPWYLFGDPATAPMLEHAYLNDQTGPKVEMEEGWNVLGTKFRVYMDFGAGPVDWRGGYKNPGAAN